MAEYREDENHITNLNVEKKIESDPVSKFENASAKTKEVTGSNDSQVNKSKDSSTNNKSSRLLSR